MKSVVNWSTFCSVAAFLLASCADPPQYSNLPIIEFDNIIYKNTTDADSLIITVKFRDGDGDLGIDPYELNPPFNPRFYFRLADGQPTIAKDQPLITYLTKRTKPGYDTLPPFIKPYSCINWEITTNTSGKFDTLYFQLNNNHYNIFVDYFIKNNNGSFTKFDFQKEFCTTYNGRFPILSKDLSQKTPLDGSIRYSMVSTANGFLYQFCIKTLKLAVTIKDRTLNKSNTVETQEFTLQSIKKSG